MTKKYQGKRLFPRFPGKFFTWRATIFVDQENRSKDVLLVFSSGKRDSVKEYLWLKLVWNQLTSIEYLLFLSILKETDYREWNYLKFLLEIPVSTLRKRLMAGEQKKGLVPSSKERYNGYLRLRVEIQKETKRLPKTKKFSGYIKSLAQRGKSKLGSGGIEPPKTSLPEYKLEENQDVIWSLFLSKPSLDTASEQEKVSPA
jgi:hypothetical protein